MSGTTVLAGTVREMNGKKIRVSAQGGSREFDLTFSYGFPSCKVGDEVVFAIQVFPPVVLPTVRRGPPKGDIEKGRPSKPGPA